MNIKIHSAELNRMMKTLTKCIGSRDMNYGNIEMIYDNNMLSLRGTNGMFSAVMTTPVLGGDGETICVDGETFGKVCALGKGEIEISTSGKVCTIKGAGRTRIPIVDAKIPAFKRPGKGSETRVQAQDFAKGFDSVAYAIGSDESAQRLVLTGVNMEVGQDSLRMVTLDGFKMATEGVVCSGDEMKMVVPGAFMRLIKDSTVAGEEITIRTDGTRVMASTEGMMIACPLLNGEFPDYKRLFPTEHKTECLVNAEQLKTVLKNSAVVCNSSKLVKFEIDGNAMTVSGNSEQADYEAELACSTQGNGLKIAFNQKYMADTIASIDAEEVVMEFNSPSSPCVVHGKGQTGLRLVLPVRVQG